MLCTFLRQEVQAGPAEAGQAPESQELGRSASAVSRSSIKSSNLRQYTNTRYYSAVEYSIGYHIARFWTSVCPRCRQADHIDRRRRCRVRGPAGRSLPQWHLDASPGGASDKGCLVYGSFGAHMIPAQIQSLVAMQRGSP